MPKKVVNLSLAAVVREIENILATYPNHAYQQAFCAPDFRRRLIAHVLRQARRLYTVMIDDTQSISLNSLQLSPENQQYIEALVRQGVSEVLQENIAWAS